MAKDALLVEGQPARRGQVGGDARALGVSRKTGHKLKRRYEELGVIGLEDQRRAPKHIPHKTPDELVELIVAERLKHPTWGPKKLKEVMEQQLGRPLPAASTIGSWLARRGLCEQRKVRPRRWQRPSTLTPAVASNDVWCVDYKGQFRLGDQTYCYPLTVTDQFSRFILGCDAMAAIDEDQARDSMEMIFRERGLPSVMRSDNGVPFATNGLAGLSKLSVYWMRLGIRPERIRPAQPQENGQHERMHRTLKRETTRPPRRNLLQQQEAFDSFVEEFNTVRPHEALDMQRPAQVYQPSSRSYPDLLPEPDYPMHDDVVRVAANGSLNLYRRKQTYVSGALSQQLVGIREEDDGRWLVSFMDLDLGYMETNNTFIPISPTPPGSDV